MTRIYHFLTVALVSLVLAAQARLLGMSDLVVAAAYLLAVIHGVAGALAVRALFDDEDPDDLDDRWSGW